MRCAARRSMTSRDRNKSCAPHERISLHTPLVHVRRSSDRHAGVRACNYIRYTYTTGTRRSSGCTWVFFFFEKKRKWKKKKTAVVVVVGDEECAKLLGQLTAIRRRRRRNSSHRKILNNIQCLQNILVFVSVQTQWAHIYPPIVRTHITTTTARARACVCVRINIQIHVRVCVCVWCERQCGQCGVY